MHFTAILIITFWWRCNWKGTCRRVIRSGSVAYPIKLTKKGAVPYERPFTWKLLPHINKRGLRSDTHKWNRKSDNVWSDPEQQIRRKTTNTTIGKSDGHGLFSFQLSFKIKTLSEASCATFSCIIVMDFAWWHCFWT